MAWSASSAPGWPPTATPRRSWRRAPPAVRGGRSRQPLRRESHRRLEPRRLRGADGPRMLPVPPASWAHPAFDLAAWSAGLGLSALLYRWRLKGLTAEVAGKVGGGYFAALALGAIPGAWLSGSLNTLRAAHPALSHSVVGALVGAIVGVEVYKAVRGVKGSTGGVFVGPFALGVVIGRWGCLF